jgi:hypothetical protein
MSMLRGMYHDTTAQGYVDKYTRRRVLLELSTLSCLRTRVLNKIPAKLLSPRDLLFNSALLMNFETFGILCTVV